MQGFSINEVALPPKTIQGQLVPPTGTGGWGADCQPGIDGTTPTADFLNDLLGNVLRVLDIAKVVPTANRFDDLAQAIQRLIDASAQQTSDDIGGLLEEIRRQVNGLGPFVRQGGGILQGTNKLYIGWKADATGVAVTVDTTDMGTIVFEAEYRAGINAVNDLINQNNQAISQSLGGLQRQIDAIQQQGGAWTTNNLQPLTLGGIGNNIWMGLPRGSATGQIIAGPVLDPQDGGTSVLPGSWLVCGAAVIASDWRGVYANLVRIA